jgi:ABC-type branched-subunit amino acid transport system substrate-binding protein
MTDRATAGRADRLSADRPTRSWAAATRRRATATDHHRDIATWRRHGPSGGRRAGLAAIAVLMIAVVAGCKGTDADDAANPDTMRLYGSDGNMNNSFSVAFKDHPGLLNGMKGTSPLTPLLSDFKARVKGVDPQLGDFSYAGEGYDAVVIAALAAETARSTDAPQIAKYITSVTVARTAGGVTCDTVKDCLDGLRTGKDIAYRGVTLRRGGLTERGEPSTAMYGTLQYGRDNQLDEGKTEYVAAGDENTVAKEPAAPPAANGRPARAPTPLRIGSLLPKTGDLAFAGPPIFAAVELAVRDLNEAGGILGQPVQYVEGDDGTNPNVANATVDRHLANGVQVIVGAAASGISKAVLPKVVAAQRVLISPSATSDELSTIDDKGFFFRTSPPDVLQSKALADVIMRYGAQRVALIARDDTYGIGLRDKVAQELKTAGIGPDHLKILKYDVRDQYKIDQFNPQAKEIIGFKPDSVLVIGFEESANVIKALAGLGVKFHD